MCIIDIEEYAVVRSCRLCL